MSKTFIYSILLCLTLMSGCSGKLFTIHKIDVQQGNAVEVEKVEKLAVGMTKEQVEFLLGSPMMTDIFHPERWDYIYALIPGYGEKERRHVSIIFNGDRVVEIIKSDMTTTPEKNQITPEIEADSNN